LRFRFIENGNKDQSQKKLDEVQNGKNHQNIGIEKVIEQKKTFRRLQTSVSIVKKCRLTALQKY